MTRTPGFGNYKDKYKVDVPVGKSGEWEIRRIVVSPQDAEITSITALSSSYGRGYVSPGTYTGLFSSPGQRFPIMSDTRDEIRDHLGFIHAARGDILIAGLGIGMALQAVLMKDAVSHVTVIEKSTDVISLVADHYYAKFGHDRLEIVNADIFEWKPPKGRAWAYAWFDIWDDIDVGNRSEMTRLRRKFGRSAKVKMCWCEALIEHMYQQGKKEQRRYGYWAF